MESALIIIPLITGYLLDLLIGDPHGWPHPVILFGNLISAGEKQLNKKTCRFLKGMLLTLTLCLGTFFILHFALNFIYSLNHPIYILVSSVFVFWGLANNNLIAEGKKVFDQLKLHGLEAGRVQLSYIVGRHTSQLNAQQIRVAVFETMSENLSDGVIAPLFYYAIAGVPGMLTYKVINTLDSMIGYRSERYEQFGKFAARLDDVANYIPARITAFLMVLVSFSKRGFTFIYRYGNLHKSPNAGYPESALAGILNLQFGGPNIYFGTLVNKPYIGENKRAINADEIKTVSNINHKTCLLMIILIIGLQLLFSR